MFDVKALIETGLQDGKDYKKLLTILADSINNDDSKIETFETLYDEIYGSTLCDSFCVKFVESMFNDTEKGKKWTLDQTNEIARKIGITFNDDYTQHEFWCAMHMMYYDYSETLSESGITDATIYGKMADDFLDDADAPDGKLVHYFFFIEKHKDI